MTNSGVIDLQASYTGNTVTHIITYSFPGSCGISHNEQVTIGVPNAGFNLNSSFFCLSGGTPVIANMMNERGRFRVFDANNDTVNTANNYTANGHTSAVVVFPTNLMTPGEYTVEFTLDTVAGCSNIHTEYFTIRGTEPSAVAYPQTSYCPLESSIQTPQITPPVNPNASYSWSTPQLGLDISNASGAITPSNSNPGIYDIVLKAQDSICLDSFPVGQITIDSLLQSNIDYAPVFCKAPGYPDPTPLSGPGNITGSLSISGDLTSGQGFALRIGSLIDFAGDRTYLVTFVPDSSQCALPFTDTVIVRQFMGGLDYPDYSICPANDTLFAQAHQLGNWATKHYIWSDTNQQSPAHLQVDLATGAIDPANSSPGTYQATMILENGICVDSFHAPTPITINADPDPLFILDSEVCHNITLSEIIPITPGGDITESVVISDSANPSLQINGMNIDPSNSVPGTYQITYDLSQSHDCPVESSQFITIHPMFQSDFNYNGQQIFCSTENENLIPITNGGQGYFSSSPDTIVNEFTGEIDSLIAGNFWIYYTADTSLHECVIIDSLPIQIINGNNPTFDYFETTYCQSDSVALVNDTSLFALGGIFFQASGDSLQLNTSSGQITMTANDTGRYDIGYILPSGGCPDTLTSTIFITPPDHITGFGYPDSTWCQQDSVIKPIWVNNSDLTGTFFSTQTVGWANDTTNGAINLNSNETGSKIIGYAWGDVCRDTLYYPLQIIPYDQVDLEFGIDSLCSFNSLDPMLALPQGGLFEIASGSVDSLSNSTGHIIPSSQYPQKIVVQYTAGATCPNSVKDSFFVRLPGAQIDSMWLDKHVICDNQRITIAPDVDKIWYYVRDSLVAYDLREITYQCTNYENEIVLVQDSGNVCVQHHIDTVIANPIPSVNLPFHQRKLAATLDLEVDLTSNEDSTKFLFSQSHNGADSLLIDSLGLPLFMVPDPVSVPLTIVSTDIYTRGKVTLFVQPLSKGCYGPIDSLKLDINPGTEAIFIPEVITPNGDNINDDWEFWWISDVVPSDYTLTLYNNSMGEIVTITDLNRKWTRDEINVPSGVYWWILKNKEGETEQTGGLTIAKTIWQAD